MVIFDSPVVKCGLMLVSAKLMAFSGRVREVEAGDDCVRDRGLCTLIPLPALPLLHNIGTAKVSICRCSCCNCFCCSHSNDYRKKSYNTWVKQKFLSDGNCNASTIVHSLENAPKFLFLFINLTMVYLLVSSVLQFFFPISSAQKNHNQQESVRVPSIGLLKKGI